jgi:hypothetical protein
MSLYANIDGADPAPPAAPNANPLALRPASLRPAASAGRSAPLGAGAGRGAPLGAAAAPAGRGAAFGTSGANPAATMRSTAANVSFAPHGGRNGDAASSPLLVPLVASPQASSASPVPALGVSPPSNRWTAADAAEARRVAAKAPSAAHPSSQSWSPSLTPHFAARPPPGASSLHVPMSDTDAAGPGPGPGVSSGAADCTAPAAGRFTEPTAAADPFYVRPDPRLDPAPYDPWRPNDFVRERARLQQRRQQLQQQSGERGHGAEQLRDGSRDRGAEGWSRAWPGSGLGLAHQADAGTETEGRGTASAGSATSAGGGAKGDVTGEDVYQRRVRMTAERHAAMR